MRWGEEDRGQDRGRERMGNFPSSLSSPPRPATLNTEMCSPGLLAWCGRGSLHSQARQTAPDPAPDPSPTPDPSPAWQVNHVHL